MAEIEIGNKFFKTKTSAEKFIRKILYKHPLGTPLTGDDLVFVCDLIAIHPNSKIKIGKGIKSITTEIDAKYGTTTHFTIIRKDGTKIDFSFKKCLSLNLNSKERLFKHSARKVIANQIISFRDNYFLQNEDDSGRVKCQISGILIDKNNSHVDHKPPNTFIKIISDYITIKNIDIENIKIIEAPDGVGRVFADNNLKDDFSDYHKDVASLRITSPIANLTLKKK